MALLSVQILPARAENQMGYQLVTAQAAASMPRQRGSLGMDIERAQQITDGGMTFDIIRVKSVRRGSPGAQAGFGPGDQIIAVNGKVFASLQAFAGYVGGTAPGTRVNVDYIPSGGGPAQAQRVAVVVGAAGAAAAPSTGMSTGEKVAIGVGAAALLGCYEMGCFSHKSASPAQANGQSSMQNQVAAPNAGQMPANPQYQQR